MFRVTLTTFTAEKTVVWNGWFTTNEVKKNLKTWASSYDKVEIVSAHVGVLEVTQFEVTHD